MKYCEFLEQYRLYTQGNETPEIIHLWLGLATLAGAAGKMYWLKRGFFNIYLNLYILLIGPPGIISKTTSMGISEDLLEEIGADVYSGTITKAKMVEDMVDSMKTCELDCGESFVHSSVIYMADEFNAVLSSGGQDIVQFLTEIYSKDRKYKSRTKGSGQYEIPHPALTLVGNMVPAWFGKNLATDMSATGLLARFIPIYADVPRGSYSLPVVSKEQEEARGKALEILFYVITHNGELVMSEEAEKRYDDWYNKQEIDPTEDARIADYLVRKIRTYSLKVAGLMALGDARTEVQVVDLERAFDLLDEVDKRIRLAYMMAGANPYAVHINRVLKILESSESGSVNLKQIARMLRTDLDVEGFRSVIEQIETMGYAIQTKRKNGWYLEKTRSEN